MFNATKLNKQLKLEIDFFDTSRKMFSWIYLIMMLLVMIYHDNPYQMNYVLVAVYYLFFIGSTMYFENTRVITCGNKFTAFPILYVLASKSRNSKYDALEISDEVADKWNSLVSEDRKSYTSRYIINSYVLSAVSFGLMWAIPHFLMKIFGV